MSSNEALCIVSTHQVNWGIYWFALQVQPMLHLQMYMRWCRIHNTWYTCKSHHTWLLHWPQVATHDSTRRPIYLKFPSYLFIFIIFFYEVATTGPATFWPTPLVHELGILGKFVLVHVQYLLLCNYIISKLSSIQEAEERHLKAIEIKERLLGRDDYEVALSVGHLASLYNYDMKKYPEAEKLYLRSIAIGKLVYWHLNILFHLCCMSSNLFCCLKANIQVDYC